MSAIIPDKIKVSNFYQYAVHLIFAIIVANSFALSSEIIIPIDMVFTDKENLALAASLLLTYVVIIAGWVGYARSMSTKPHKDNYKGALRFLVDLVILFENFYLLQLITTEKFISDFHIVISLMFLTYIVWDLIKYFEYKSKEARKLTKNRSGRTIVCAVICVILSIFYHLGLTNTDSSFQFFIDEQSRMIFFIFLMLILVAFYRLWKWNIRHRKQSTKIRVNKNNSNKSTSPK